MSSRDRLPAVNDVVTSAKKNVYTLVEIIGEGGYGSVFLAKCDKDNRLVALKAEKYSKTVLRIEVGVLKVTTAKNCKHICKLIEYGQVNKEFMFVVMTLLGPDLNKLRNDQPGRHFTTSTILRVAIQTLNAVQELHECGFISRDVKPGNFAIGRKEERMQRTIFIFDFGLARKYIDKNANILKSRGEMGWRGTTRYGSLHAHHKQDLSRRDDLESWLYMIVELTKGALPWRLVTDRALVQKAKEEARGAGKTKFFMMCPARYTELLTIIDQLEFQTTPPYDKLYAILNESMITNKVNGASRYDWEDAGTSNGKCRELSEEKEHVKRSVSCNQENLCLPAR